MSKLCQMLSRNRLKFHTDHKIKFWYVSQNTSFEALWFMENGGVAERINDELIYDHS